MRRVICICLILLFVLAFAQGNAGKRAPMVKVNSESSDTLPPSKARISFDSESFDFGFAPQGAGYLVHYFGVTNVGEDTLVIKRVRPTCGCTAAPLKKKQLAPGESTEIGAIFRLRGFKRATSKAIKVESNDPTRKLVSLRFNANMDTSLWHDTSKGARIFSEPEMVDMGKGDLLQWKTNVKLKNPTDKKLNLKIIEYTENIIKEPKIKRTTLKPGKSTDMEISLLEDYDINTQIKASITIAAFDKSGSEVTRISIPIIGAGK